MQVCALMYLKHYPDRYLDTHLFPQSLIGKWRLISRFWRLEQNLPKRKRRQPDEEIRLERKDRSMVLKMMFKLIFG